MQELDISDPDQHQGELEYLIIDVAVLLHMARQREWELNVLLHIVSLLLLDYLNPLANKSIDREDVPKLTTYARSLFTIQ